VRVCAFCYCLLGKQNLNCANVFNSPIKVKDGKRIDVLIKELIMSRIRPISLACFVRNDEALLVMHGFDAHKSEVFFRFPGGGIELGETGAEAIQREIREELSEDIFIRRHLGYFENIFTYRGKPHHEIVQIFLTEFADPTAYHRSQMELTENYPGQRNPIASWLPIEDFLSRRRILYPAGILGALEEVLSPARSAQPTIPTLAAPVLVSKQAAQHLLAACHEAGARKFIVDHLIEGAEPMSGACYEFSTEDPHRYVVSQELSLAAGTEEYPETCHYHTVKTEIYLGGFHSFALWRLGHPETAIIRRDFDGVIIIPPLWCHLMRPKPALSWTIQIPNPVAKDKHDVPVPENLAAQLAMPR
jgi:ADP-ribose pyrophosphatase YjhB (NUDIX family)